MKLVDGLASLRMAGVLLAVLISVGCTESGEARQVDLPDRGELVDATYELASEIVVAASAETYLSHEGDLLNLELQLKEESGGVWCGGAVALAIAEWRGRGWNVGSLSYGRQGGWTHMVAVVETTDGWLIADPYLGNVWAEDLMTSVERVRNGRAPLIINFGAERDVVFAKPPSRDTSSWVVGRHTEKPVDCARNGAVFVCSVHHDYLDYEERHHLSSGFLDFLESQGFEGTILSGVFSPYGVNVPNQGWVDVEDIGEVITLFEDNSSDFGE